MSKKNNKKAQLGALMAYEHYLCDTILEGAEDLLGGGATRSGYFDNEDAEEVVMPVAMVLADEILEAVVKGLQVGKGAGGGGSSSGGKSLAVSFVFQKFD